MLFSSWASWAGDWRRRPGMFEHLRFYSNGFPLWCNVSIRFYCMMVSLMTTGQSRVHFPTSFVVFFCNFWATRAFPLVKIIIIIIIIIIITTTIFIVLSSTARGHMREFTLVPLGESRSTLGVRQLVGLASVLTLCPPVGCHRPNIHPSLCINT